MPCQRSCLCLQSAAFNQEQQARLDSDKLVYGYSSIASIAMMRDHEMPCKN
jgi:hypothetical protein